MADITRYDLYSDALQFGVLFMAEVFTGAYPAIGKREEANLG